MSLTIAMSNRNWHAIAQLSLVVVVAVIVVGVVFNMQDTHWKRKGLRGETAHSFDSIKILSELHFNWLITCSMHNNCT